MCSMQVITFSASFVAFRKQITTFTCSLLKCRLMCAHHKSSDHIQKHNRTNESTKAKERIWLGSVTLLYSDMPAEMCMYVESACKYTYRFLSACENSRTDVLEQIGPFFCGSTRSGHDQSSVRKAWFPPTYTVGSALLWIAYLAVDW